MTMDPSLPGLLLQAARAVAEVRSAVNTTARAAAAAHVPGWQGGAAARHRAELGQLQTEVTRAVNAIAALETGLGSAAATARTTVEAEAAAARAAAAAQERAAAEAAAAAQGRSPVYGPPWPGAGSGYPSY